MKKIFVTMLLALLCCAAFAQPGSRRHQQQPARQTVSFDARHGEEFIVYVDGDPINRIPQTRVSVADLGNQQHEVVVLLRQPAEKVAVMTLYPNNGNVNVSVSYDRRQNQLLLNSNNMNARNDARNNPPDRGHGQRSNNQPIVEQTVVINTPVQQLPPPEPVGVSDEECNGMVVRMKNQSFDSDRLQLGKTIVAASPLTAAQITRLAETFDHSSNQVEFLKYAYSYCIDKPNYYKTTDILTFSSDKKKILDHIATQH